MRKIPLHPFLFALYPILYLLAVNIDQISPLEAFRSMAIPFIGCTILFILIALFTRDIQKAAIVAAFWVLAIYLLFFFLYVPLYHAVEKKVILGVNIGRHRNLLLLLLIFLGICTGWILHQRRNLEMATAILNVVAVALVLFPIAQITSYKVQASQLLAPDPFENQPESAVNLTEGETPPDIYYIVLDMYTREDVLRDFFEYDNSSFVQFLKNQGFYVADCSQSNYNATQYSIGSALNMNYLPELGLEVDDPTLYQALQQNQVMTLFAEMGYHTVAFESGFSYTELRDADEFLGPYSSAWDRLSYGGVNSFEAMVLKNSAGSLVYEAEPNMSREKQIILDTPYIQYRERITYALDKLETIASQSGPKFVFAHVLAPHDPFVFEQDGSYVFRKTPFTLNGDREYLAPEEYILGYTNELEYLNERVEAIVNAILTKSDTPPVIIIQGDHGVPRMNGIHGGSAILNAYYLPGGGAEQLYPTISPVNSFRVVFDRYFNGQFSLLEDEAFKLNNDAKTYDAYDGYACSAQ